MYQKAQNAAKPLRFTKKAKRAIVAAALMTPLAIGATAAVAIVPTTDVPDRNIVKVESATGAVFEFDAASLSEPGIVSIDGEHLHFDLAEMTVQNEGWELTRYALDPASPIQAYSLSPAG